MSPTLTQRQQAMLQAPPSLMNKFYDCDTTLTFDYVLSASQTINGLQQPIARDGDFYLCGIQMTSVQFQRPDLIELAALAGMRISDDLGYKLMSDFIGVNFLSPSFGNGYPFVINPSHLFKAGTRINIDLQEQSNVSNIIQIAFRGRYRYRMSDVQAQGKLLAQARKFKGGQ